MFQPGKTSIKQDIAFIVAIAAAGFKYVTYKLTDTPESRERVKLHEKNRKIDFFIADLFSPTNQPKGA